MIDHLSRECTINFPGAKTTHFDDLEILRARKAAEMNLFFCMGKCEKFVGSCLTIFC
jgi:hypothetical protein